MKLVRFRGSLPRQGESTMEMVFNFVVGAFLLVFLIGGFTISPETVATDLLGARGVPMIFAGIGLVLLALSILERRRIRAGSGEAEKENPAGRRKTLAIIGLLLVYILAVPYMGFTLGTLLLSFISVRVIGYAHAGRAALFSLFLTAVLVVVFGKVFFIALPRGIGMIKEISYFLY